MSPELNEFRQYLIDKKFKLNNKQKQNLHFNSIINFFFHFDNLTEGKDKRDVENLLLEYFEVVKTKGYSLDLKDRKNYFYSHIEKIGGIFHLQLGFKVFMGIPSALFGGIITDLVMLVFGVLKLLYYIPLFTLLLVGYNFFLLKFYGNKKKLYVPSY